MKLVEACYVQQLKKGAEWLKVRVSSILVCSCDVLFNKQPAGQCGNIDSVQLLCPKDNVPLVQAPMFSPSLWSRFLSSVPLLLVFTSLLLIVVAVMRPRLWGHLQALRFSPSLWSRFLSSVPLLLVITSWLLIVMAVMRPRL
jgi:hypothetical protein